jgi:2-iminobutanoate/2-iminopropanoate deaminase
MKRMTERISTTDAPQAIGPYSQAIGVDRYVFCSGQIGLDPATGELVDGGITQQAERALRNLEGVLKAAALTMENVVKTTVFLSSMDQFAALNEVYAGFFGDPPPARSTVAVKELPRGALVEVEAIAFRDKTS